MATTPESSPASPTAVALVAAAVAAAPPAPAAGTTGSPNRQHWLADVGELATALYRQAQRVDLEVERLAETTPIAGVIVSVAEATGRGLITLRPTMGAHASDPEATEPLRTPWLSEPAGAALFAQARSLIGRHVRLGKYLETGADGRRFRMVAWIDAVDLVEGARPSPAAQPVPRRPARPQSVPPAPPANVAASLVERVNALADGRARATCMKDLVANLGRLDELADDRVAEAVAIVARYELVATGGGAA